MYYYIKFKICQTMIKLNRLFTGLFLSAHLLVQSQIHEMNISTYKPGAPIQLTCTVSFLKTSIMVQTEDCMQN